ncbi:MAG: hypothetical protein DLM55_07140 [Acidimicrobiales bacterium]|nr:MAG: hypothetical protein DLM55_07140 [Acidimicrobiales bacterium]
MTTKELIHELVEKLDEDGARRVLSFALTQRASEENLPSWAGRLRSGDPHRGRNAKQIVREGMGRRKAHTE